MMSRGTCLLLHLSTTVPAGLESALGSLNGESFVQAVHEDLLDMVSTWRRVGREREVVVLLDGDDDAAMRRVARRGLVAEPGHVTRAQLAQRAVKSLANSKVVAVIDCPPPDFAIAMVDRLVRKAREGLAVVADLDGEWLAFSMEAQSRGVLDGGPSLEMMSAHARLAGIALHPMTPSGRLDSVAELHALGLRFREQRARAPRSRRVLQEASLLGG